MWQALGPSVDVAGSTWRDRLCARFFAKAVYNVGATISKELVSARTIFASTHPSVIHLHSAVSCLRCHPNDSILIRGVDVSIMDGK